MKIISFLLILILFTLNISAQNKVNITNPNSTVKNNLHKVFTQIDSKFDNNNAVNKDFWLITNNSNLEKDILNNGKKSKYDKFNIDMNSAIKYVNLDLYLLLKSYFPSNIDKSKLTSFFKNSNTQTKIRELIDNIISKYQIIEQYEDLGGYTLSTNAINNTSIPTPFKDANEMNEFGEKKKFKSLSAPVGDAINQADIDSRTKANLDKMNRAKSQYEEAQKRLDGLKTTYDSLQKNYTDRELLNQGYTGAGVSSSGTSIDPTRSTPPLPTATYKDPKLDPIPKAEYAKMQMSWHSPSSGSSGNTPKDYIYNTLLNHYLILFGL
jgi:hypothetical protein